MHSNMSDGTDTPEELLEKAVGIGLAAFSVTDHDDIRSNASMLSALAIKPRPIAFITGAEFASVFENRNLHLLSYGFDPSSEPMKRMGEEAAKLRRQRISAMFSHLRMRHGIVIPQEAQAEIMRRVIPGKIHIADAAQKLGVDMPHRDFIGRYLNDMDDRFYKIPAARIIQTVAGAGGAVSFAHPIETQREHSLTLAELAGMVKRLKDVGLGAIEAYHSSHGPEEVESYRGFAEKYGLRVSGGSDYHGGNKAIPLARLTAYGYVPRAHEITLLSAT